MHHRVSVEACLKTNFWLTIIRLDTRMKSAFPRSKEDYTANMISGLCRIRRATKPLGTRPFAATWTNFAAGWRLWRQL
jgi:hypothetical protein